jgi:hypothetical protein
LAAAVAELFENRLCPINFFSIFTLLYIWLKRGEKMLSIDTLVSANGLRVQKLLQKKSKKSAFSAEFHKMEKFWRKSFFTDMNDIYL